MNIPPYVVVAQWVMLLAFGSLLILIYRQLGRYFKVMQGSEESAGPQVGTRAPVVQYRRIGDDDAIQSMIPGGNGQASLVAFVDPTCTVCEELVGSLEATVNAGELEGICVLLLISEPPSFLQISDVFRATQLEMGSIIATTTREDYAVTSTPLLVAIDAIGIVRATGHARLRSHVRALAAACLAERNNRAFDPVKSTGSYQENEPTAVSAVLKDAERR